MMKNSCQLMAIDCTLRNDKLPTKGFHRRGDVGIKPLQMI